MTTTSTGTRSSTSEAPTAARTSPRLEARPFSMRASIWALGGFFLSQSFLLSHFNPSGRCLLWSPQCTRDELWILNWNAFGQFHVAVTWMSLIHDKARLNDVLLCSCAILWVYITQAIDSMPLWKLTEDDVVDHASEAKIHQRRQLWITQLISASLLCMWLLRDAAAKTSAVLRHDDAAAKEAVEEDPTNAKDDLWDATTAFLSLPSFESLVLGLHIVVSSRRLVGNIMGDEFSYLGDSSSTNFQILAQSTMTQRFLVLVLLWYAFWCCGGGWAKKRLLAMQSLCLFVSQIMLAGTVGDDMNLEEIQSTLITNFCLIVLGILAAI